MHFPFIMKKFLPFGALIILVLAIGFATYNLKQKQDIAAGQNNEEYGVHFVKTKIALPEFSVPDLYDENKFFTKKDLIGKYSIINFFASWCTTCRAEHDILLNLKSQNIIAIYGIAWRDISDNTKSYLEKSGNPFTKVANDASGQFTKIGGISAIPETWIVDKEGVVIARFRGNLQGFSIEEIKEFIK